MIDSDSYFKEMREIVLSGQSVSMIVSGNSMVPFLVNQRDFILIEPVTAPLHKGDMCFFKRRDGRFIMHRICRVKGNQYYFTGDGQPVIEGPIDRTQIFGIITKVKRKGKWITKGDFCWFFFEKVWIRIIPLRMTILKVYSILHR